MNWSRTRRSSERPPGGVLLDRIADADGAIVMTDFDGTIAPIRSHPDDASILPACRAALATITNRRDARAAVVSGRALADVRSRVGLSDCWYAGNHGLEIDTGEEQFVHPDARGTRDAIDAVLEALRDRLHAIDGVLFEDKGLTGTVHYRQVTDPDSVERIRAAVDTVVSSVDAVAAHHGREIVELRPTVDWNKGRAVRWLLDRAVRDDRNLHPAYIGDDTTDEAAFRALDDVGTTIRVGNAHESTDAEFSLEDPSSVATLLERVAKSPGIDG